MVNHVGNGPKTSKCIQMHSEWAIMFAATKVAILFTYPHHAGEFSEYEKFIISQFTVFLLMPHNTPASSCSITPSVSAWPALTTCHSITVTTLVTSSPIMSSLEAALPPPNSQAQQPRNCTLTQMTPMSKFAAGGMPAAAPLIHESTVTSASPAARSTKRKIVEVLNEARE